MLVGIISRYLDPRMTEGLRVSRGKVTMILELDYLTTC